MPAAPTISAETATEDLAAFLTSFTDAMCFSDEDAAAVVDRHYPSGVVQRSDGVTFDRERLIAHARPSRKNTISATYDVHEAFVSGSRFAARYTLHAEHRKLGPVVSEVYLLGELDESGRPCRIDQITRNAGAS